MSYMETMIDRVTAVSERILTYVDGEHYCTSIDDSDDFTLPMLFPKVIQMVIGELKETGLTIDMDFTDVYDNTNLVSGIIALFEYFDYRNFTDAIRDEEDFKRRCHGMLQSLEIEPGQMAVNILDLCTNFKIGDLSRLDEIQPLLSHLTSSKEFDEIIGRFLDSAVTRSKLHDDNVPKFMLVLNVVNFLWKEWDKVWTILVDNGVVGDSRIYFNDYAKYWLDPMQAEQNAWILNLCNPTFLEDIRHSRPNRDIDILRDIHEDRCRLTPGYINYYANRHTVIEKNDLAMLMTNGVMWRWAQTRETFAPYLWLLVSPKHYSYPAKYDEILTSYVLSNNIHTTWYEHVRPLLQAL